MSKSKTCPALPVQRRAAFLQSMGFSDTLVAANFGLLGHHISLCKCWFPPHETAPTKRFLWFFSRGGRYEGFRFVIVVPLVIILDWDHEIDHPAIGVTSVMETMETPPFFEAIPNLLPGGQITMRFQTMADLLAFAAK